MNLDESGGCSVGPTQPLAAGAVAQRLLAPTAVGQLLAALESLSVLGTFRSNALLRGRASEKKGGLLRHRLRRALDTSAGAAVLQVMTIAGATLILSSGSRRRQQIAGTAIAFVANKLFEIRNPYGRDGSDQMAGVILGYRLATAPIRDHEVADDLFLRAVNAQTCLAYLASGLAKAISSSWRSGDAVGAILKTDIYGGTFVAKTILRFPLLGRLLTWLTVLWECAFPLLYAAGPRRVRPLLTAVKGFHLGVAVSMGLPRFFWGFSSAHSAVRYVVEKKAE